MKWTCSRMKSSDALCGIEKLRKSTGYQSYGEVVCKWTPVDIYKPEEKPALVQPPRRLQRTATVHAHLDAAHARPALPMSAGLERLTLHAGHQLPGPI